MTPQQLLRETQRAAGDANLTSWHDILIETGKELSSLQTVSRKMWYFVTSHCHLYRLSYRKKNR